MMNYKSCHERIALLLVILSMTQMSLFLSCSAFTLLQNTRSSIHHSSGSSNPSLNFSKIYSTPFRPQQWSKKDDNNGSTIRVLSSTSLSMIQTDSITNFQLSSNTIIQFLSGISTYIGLVAYYDRPKGNLGINQSSFELKQSRVENAGLGLYVNCSIPKGTILGTYPGVIRPASNFLQKYDSIPQTAVYTWRFTDNESCIDPTNKDGLLLDKCYGGTDDYPVSYFIHEILLRFISVPTLLARINEPPIGGGGCNVRVTENLDSREVVFELSRDVVEGEELFMDYGLTYDRSSYE